MGGLEVYTRNETHLGWGEGKGLVALHTIVLLLYLQTLHEDSLGMIDCTREACIFLNPRRGIVCYISFSHAWNFRPVAAVAHTWRIVIDRDFI